MQVLSLILLGTLLAVLQDSARAQYPALLKTEFSSRKYVTELTQPGNKCVYLSAPGPNNGLAVKYWTCGLPFVQQYCGGEMTWEYGCCPGFRQAPVKFFGAPNDCAESMSVWRLIPDFLNYYQADFDNSLFGDMIKRVPDLADMSDSNSESVYTVFLPGRTALYDGTSGFSYQNNVDSVKLMITRRKIYSNELKNGNSFQTLIPGRKLKVTTYSNGIVCVECRVLLKPDVEARNGIIHHLDGPIVPYSNPRANTILSYISSQPDFAYFGTNVFQYLKTELGSANSKHWYTLFLPRGQFINAAGISRRNFGKVIANHLLRRMICSKSITSRTHFLGPTEMGEYIGIDCTGPAQTRSVIDSCGNQIPITQADVMTDHGVIHVIDGVLTPTSAMTFQASLTCLNSFHTKYATSRTAYYSSRVVSTKYVSMMARCNFKISLDSYYVFLVPTNTYFENRYRRSAWERSFERDQCSVLSELMFSIKRTTDLRWSKIGFFKNMVLTSASGYKYYIQTVSDRDQVSVYVNGIRTHNHIPVTTENGFIFYVDEIYPYFMPNNIVSLLSSNADYVEFNKIVQASGSAYRSVFERSNLFFMVSNQGFQERKVNAVSRRAQEAFFSIHSSVTPLFQNTLLYDTIETIVSNYKSMRLNVIRGPGGEIYVAPATETRLSQYSMVLNTHDWITSSGIVWQIDWPFICKQCGY